MYTERPLFGGSDPIGFLLQKLRPYSISSFRLAPAYTIWVQFLRQKAYGVRTAEKRPFCLWFRNF